ncbi:MAG: hypothetical protein JO146_05445 [Candidatus Eremiobacteraeota bacterium]|nr:hypothetical protein [Candidatus Eremiobacteraeota bacterium]
MYGIFDIISDANPHDTIHVYVDFIGDTKATYDVVSGTGRFAHATGTGTWEFTRTGPNRYEDTWSGTLSF